MTILLQFQEHVRISDKSCREVLLLRMETCALDFMRDSTKYALTTCSQMATMRLCLKFAKLIFSLNGLMHCMISVHVPVFSFG